MNCYISNSPGPRQFHKRSYNYKAYRILDTLFLDVDEYVPDELYDLRDQFNINESELRKRLSAHLILLEQILL
ncbi:MULTISPECIES: colicin immunity domain-containing protein [unclassified Sphingobacterium]|uniref:colicin immunity domain-containing protein n=1 Tax=unclassified Sphingobacterium TaxID=2609468 RepID=UPI003918209E